MLRRVMLLLHAKEEMDAPPGADDESMNNSIEAAGKVVEAIDTAYNSDDFDLGRFSL